MQAPLRDQPRGKQAQRDLSPSLRFEGGFEDSDWSQDADLPVRPLTREEAQALVVAQPSMSVWQVIAAQALFGVLVALVWGVVSGGLTATVSALYGCAVVVVPSALMARGVFGSTVWLKAGRSVGGLFVWEMLKLGLVGAMLAMAPKWIKPLDWAAMLVTMVLCLKVIGVVLLLWQGRSKNSV
jgi:ATP synthase protein I